MPAMPTVGDVLLLLLCAMFLVPPVIWAWRLALLFQFPAPPPPAQGPLPTAAVVLALRGADASLRACLHGLLHQDYPRYRLLIVIDGPDDPAWGPVREVLAGPLPPQVEVRVEALEAPHGTCSLKVSAQIQAITRYGEGCEVIAFADADAVVPPDWLRQLVAPFAFPEVAAVSGLRWFAPPEASWGSLVRHLWNCGCQTQVYAFGIPWGGSMAIRARLLHDGGLLREWRHCFADDTAAADLIGRQGLRVHFLPALTIVNRETTPLVPMFAFASRQMINSRLDMAAWPLLLTFNVGLVLSIGLSLGMAAAGLALGDLARSAWFSGLLTLHAGGQLAALSVAELQVRRQARRRGEQAPRTAPLWRYPVAAVLALVVQCYAALSAGTARRVRWRGIDYALDGPSRVRLVRYHPYQ